VTRDGQGSHQVRVASSPAGWAPVQASDSEPIHPTRNRAICVIRVICGYLGGPWEAPDCHAWTCATASLRCFRAP